MRTRLGTCAVLVAVAVTLGLRAPGTAANTNAPLVVTASTGPAAASHITATVTRTIGKASVRLPAALVPALEPGDVVDVDFPDYRRPPASVNYHVNVAFITETAPQRWLFGRSGPADQLFSNRRSAHGRKAAPSGKIHFVYGAGPARGIPIFFIIPEDGKTRGVDGVRDYVDAHPSDFVSMSVSTNDAVDKYSNLRDFLSSLGSGSIDPSTGRQRIETLAQSVGVPPASIDVCYVPGAAPSDVRSCIQQSVNAVVYQTNFNAPTQAQFLGGVAGAVNPAALAPYVASLLTVWRIFVRTGHQEYEYLPTTIALADASTVRHDELLMGPKVPTIRPPGPYSDVLFFTIGDPQATERAPVVDNDAPANGVCERANRFSIPLHFDHTSRYVHDTALVVTPRGKAPYRIALDPRTLTAPIVDRSHFTGSPDAAYTVALTGRFGFDAIAQPARTTMHVAFPNNAPWTVTAAPNHRPVAGETLDMIASSASAACLSHAELTMGSAAPIALDATQLDARRVELRASLGGVPAGPAQIRFYEDDPANSRALTSAAAVAIAPQPAHVDGKSAVAALGDAVIALTGSGLERIRGLLLNGSTYAKDAGSTATSACFAGPPLAGAGLTVGQQITAQLLAADGTSGEVFPLTIGAPRPAIDPPVVAPATSPHLSTTPLAVTLQSAAGPLPHQVIVRLRRADGLARTPCDALRSDPVAVTLPASAVHARAANALALDFRADLLGDRAFGTLQLQVADGATGAGSPWVTLPGTFVRAPRVVGITCPSDAGAACRIYGSELAAIDAVRDASGAFVAPNLDCPPTDKGVACIGVPHLAHYTLRLADEGTIETLPDALIATASGKG
jgi:hypothetical protein